MDHKKFFDTWENRKIADPFGFSQVSYEQLYQAIKQRLIEEVVARVRWIETPIGPVDDFGKLIDTASDTGRGDG